MFESKEDKLYIHTLLYNIGEFPKLYGELQEDAGLPEGLEITIIYEIGLYFITLLRHQ